MEHEGQTFVIIILVSYQLNLTMHACMQTNTYVTGFEKTRLPRTIINI